LWNFQSRMFVRINILRISRWISSSSDKLLVIIWPRYLKLETDSINTPSTENCGKILATILLVFTGEKTIDTVVCKFHDRSISLASLYSTTTKLRTVSHATTAKVILYHQHTPKILRQTPAILQPVYIYSVWVIHSINSRKYLLNNNGESTPPCLVLLLRWKPDDRVLCHHTKQIWLEYQQESPAVADKPARRLRKVCTVYVRAVGL